MMKERILVATLLLIGLSGCATGESAAVAAAETAPAPRHGTALSIPQQTMPFPGILAAGQPTEEQFRQAAAEGFRTVINLRGPGEQGELVGEDQLVRSLGMSYLAIPISGGDGINLENAEILARALEAPGATPAIVHCASSNRVGALFALKAFRLDGVPPDEAIAIGLGAGMTRLEPVVRELLAEAP